MRLHSTDDKIKCLKYPRNLKGTSFYINEDVNPATTANKREKLDELKQKRAEWYVAYFAGVNIIAKRKTLHPVQEEASDENNARRAVVDASSASGTIANSSSETAKSGATARPGANATKKPRGKGNKGCMELRGRHQVFASTSQSKSVLTYF